MAVELRNQGLYESRREHDACGIGAVVNISGQADHTIMEYGKQIIVNLRHRGAAGADEVTGDGAGILFQVPHEFFSAECENLGFALPQPANYGVGMVFGSRDTELSRQCDNCPLRIAASAR
jgi:glutamate synthase domain-containing protein 1